MKARWWKISFFIFSHVPCVWSTWCYYRLPLFVKASKLGKSEATPAEGSLTSGKQSPPTTDPSGVPQSTFDSVRSDYMWLSKHLVLGMLSLSISFCAIPFIFFVCYFRYFQRNCIQLYGNFVILSLGKLETVSRLTIYLGKCLLISIYFPLFSFLSKRTLSIFLLLILHFGNSIELNLPCWISPSF